MFHITTAKRWLFLLLICACIMLFAISTSHYPRITEFSEQLKIRNLIEGLFPDRGEYSQLDGNRKEIEKRFENRRLILQDACRRHGNSTDFKLLRANFFPLPLYRPVMNVSVKYCPIEKTASTSWKYIFEAIRTEMSIRKLKGEHDVRKADKELYFTFVREPYSRLLSAYTDKLFSANPLHWSVAGRYIVSNFRPNATRKSLQCGHDVTFPEFIKYVINAQATGKHRDGHYIPTHDHCEMCRVPYQYIGHLETISEDMPYLLREMQAPLEYTKDFDSQTIQSNTRNALVLMRAGLEKCIDLDESCRRIWKRWHIRGIISKTQSFPLNSAQTYNISETDFSQVALAALARSDDKELRKLQKKEAPREAYGSISLEDRLELRKVLFLDFEMFGFNPSPDEVFPSTPYQKDPKFSYFDLY